MSYNNPLNLLRPPLNPTTAYPTHRHWWNFAFLLTLSHNPLVCARPHFWGHCLRIRRLLWNNGWNDTRSEWVDLRGLRRRLCSDEITVFSSISPPIELHLLIQDYLNPSPARHISVLRSNLAAQDSRDSILWVRVGSNYYFTQHTFPLLQVNMIFWNTIPTTPYSLQDRCMSLYARKPRFRGIGSRCRIEVELPHFVRGLSGVHCRYSKRTSEVLMGKKLLIWYSVAWMWH